MRQTGLSFEELMHYFQNPDKSPYPVCFIVNEIGERALIGDTRASKALVFDFLKNPDAKVRYIACRWIRECCILAALCPLEKLLENEEDKQVIIEAKNALSRLRHVLGN